MIQVRICPVCQGRGAVPSGFYDIPVPGVVPQSRTAAGPECCRSCNGTGMVYFGPYLQWYRTNTA